MTLSTTYTPHFGGHQTFALRHTWIPKALPLLIETPTLFSDVDSVMVQMGIGKNMVMSVRHWLESLQLIRVVNPSKEVNVRHHVLTDVAHLMVSGDAENSDVYLERLDTLWLLHWFLATNHMKNAVWTYVFNSMGQQEFTRESLEKQITDWCEQHDYHSPSKTVLKNDIGTFIGMYCFTETTTAKDLQKNLASPFKELKLVSFSSIQNHYQLVKKRAESISDQVVSYCILHYLEQMNYPPVVSFGDLFLRPFSPGRVLQLTEDAMVHHLEQFSKLSDHRYRFDTTAGVSQLLSLGEDKTDSTTILRKIYS